MELSSFEPAAMLIAAGFERTALFEMPVIALCVKY